MTAEQVAAFARAGLYHGLYWEYGIIRECSQRVHLRNLGLIAYSVMLLNRRRPHNGSQTDLVSNAEHRTHLRRDRQVRKASYFRSLTVSDRRIPRSSSARFVLHNQDPPIY